MNNDANRTVPNRDAWNPVKLFGGKAGEDYKHFVSDLVGGRRIDARPYYSRPPERFHSAHWWEVGRPGTRKKTVIAQFERHGLRLIDSYHNVFYPHHVFFLFERVD